MDPPVAVRMTVRVKVYDRDLEAKGEVGKIIALKASRRWRDAGGWRLVVPGSAAATALKEPGSSITIETFDADGTGTVAMSGPMELAEWGPDGMLEAFGLDDLAWLEGRLALTGSASPYPETLDYTDVAETVIYSLVDDNAGPSAAAARQVVALATDEARGTSGTWKATNQPLLQLIRDIAIEQGWGLEVVQQAGTRTFRVLVPRDVSSSVRLNEANGAISTWKRSRGRPEADYVLAAGPASGGQRSVQEGGSDDVSEWGRIERWVDERQAATAGELQSARDVALADGGAVDAVAAEVQPVRSFAFGTDYGLGDTVTVKAGGISRTDTVVGVDITATTVTPVLSGGRVLPTLPSLRRLDELERRMARQETR